MTARKSEKPAELDGPPVTEALADDVAAETATFVPGTPPFRSHLQMPRMLRATAYGALGAVQAQNQKINPKAADKSETEDEPADDAPVDIDPAEYGERYKILGLIEEYLAICAVDEDVFREWALKIEDSVLVKTFNVYIKVNQPGEATSSAS